MAYAIAKTQGLQISPSSSLQRKGHPRCMERDLIQIRIVIRTFPFQFGKFALSFAHCHSTVFFRLNYHTIINKFLCSSSYPRHRIANFPAITKKCLSSSYDPNSISYGIFKVNYHTIITEFLCSACSSSSPPPPVIVLQFIWRSQKCVCLPRTTLALFPTVYLTPSSPRKVCQTDV